MYTKFKVYKLQVSTDSGVTWSDTGESSPGGEPIESYSAMSDCEASLVKYKFNYTNDRMISGACDGSTSITRNLVRGAGINIMEMVSAEIGGCIDTIDEYSFGYSGFSDTPPVPGVLTSVTLSNSVKYINDAAFRWNYALQNINLAHSNVEEIGYNAFQSCTGLTEVTFPPSLKRLKAGAFMYAGLTSATINGDDLIIGETIYTDNDVFEGCPIKRVNSEVDGVCNIPSCVKEIDGYSMFNTNYSITKVNIESGVRNISIENPFSRLPNLSAITVDSGNIAYDSRNNCNAIIRTIDNYLISGCKNTVMFNGITGIGKGAFMQCTGLTSINIPESVASIGFAAFAACINLSSVNIPDNITKIDDAAFQGCNSLRSLTLGSNITNIGYDAFPSALSDLYIYATTPPSVWADHPGLPSGCVIHVPAESVSLYSSTSPWRRYSIIAI